MPLPRPTSCLKVGRIHVGDRWTTPTERKKWLGGELFFDFSLNAGPNCCVDIYPHSIAVARMANYPLIHNNST